MKQWAKQKQPGFTIVELLIVIVVIGILAAITIIAYNGIQQRSRNAQTISAVTAWAKAVKLYEADNGIMPTPAGCLGTNYTYGSSGTDVSGFQCRQDNVSVGLNIAPSLNALLQKYLPQQLPEPAMATYILSTTSWFRGAYFYNTTPARIDFVLEGRYTTCPLVTGMSLVSQQNTSTTETTRCALAFGS
jgi:general secretion pathway protein G